MFRTVDVPMLLDTPEQRAEYVAKNYWNHFDFSDTSYVDLPEVTEQAFADYVNLLGQMHGELASQSVRITLSKAEADSAMYGYFVGLFEKYLYDPNSPMRNEELYIPALEAMIASERLGEADKVRAVTDWSWPGAIVPGRRQPISATGSPRERGVRCTA